MIISCEVFFDVPVHNDWHTKAELWSECWLPFWSFDGFKDWVKDVFFNCFEDSDADTVKWYPDQVHEPVPSPHDPVWDEVKDVSDPVEDWPEELKEEVENEPPDAPEVVM